MAGLGEGDGDERDAERRRACRRGEAREAPRERAEQRERRIAHMQQRALRRLANQGLIHAWTTWCRDVRPSALANSFPAAERRRSCRASNAPCACAQGRSARIETRCTRSDHRYVDLHPSLHRDGNTLRTCAGKCELPDAPSRA